jgi:hypothetical protein
MGVLLSPVPKCEGQGAPGTDVEGAPPTPHPGVWEKFPVFNEFPA